MLLSSRRCDCLMGALCVGALLTSLAASNPGPEAFASFAGERLAQRISQKLCQGEGGGSSLQALMVHCDRLVLAQREQLGVLAARSSRRQQLGLLSLYSTELGGQRLLGRWRLPRVQALTLGIGGQFLLLHTQELHPGQLS